MPYLITNGVTTYCEVHGSGQPLILLHSTLLDHRMWYPQVSELAGRYQVIVYDLRGHGKTGPTGSTAYSMDLLVEDLRGLITGLNLCNPVLCGLSLGGMVAQGFATRHPQMLSGLILCDTNATMAPALLNRMQIPVFCGVIQLLGTQRFTQILFSLTRSLHKEAWFGQREDTRTYVQQCMGSIPAAEMAKILGLVSRYQPADPSRLCVPTLLIYGWDQNGPRNPVQRVPARFIGVPNTDHTIPLDNPTMVNTVLSNFLAVLSQLAFQQ